MRYGARAVLASLVVVLMLVLLVWVLGVRDDVPPEPMGDDAALPSDAQRVAQGAYLARAGNCRLCHTQRGGSDYAGGRTIETPFGSVYSSNLTPDAATGLGTWTSADFWRAMHHGKSKGGRLLVPAFPYTSMTLVSRADSDALFAYLRSLPAVGQANRPSELRWPYNTQAALAVWRALYFKAEAFSPDTRQTAQWNRGAYLVRGLGHCNACHTPRNALGGVGSNVDLSGGPIPMLNWYAPSLLLAGEAAVGDWSDADVVRLLQSGVAPRGSVLGPMAEVVQHSTQFLSVADLAAMAVFLKSLQSSAPLSPAAMSEPARIQPTSPGAVLYNRHCAHCHGDTGAGVPGAYPALAGNRAVLLANTSNLVQVLLHGGFPPATQGNPRPFGMPPLMFVLSDAEVAAVLSYIRAAWGNHAGEVSELEVTRNRTAAER